MTGLRRRISCAASPKPGALMFHQSGGCCDGSTAMCHPAGEFLAGEADLHPGGLWVEGVSEVMPLWMSQTHYKYGKDTHLTVDVVPGRGGGLSVEAPQGVRFLIRSRLMGEDGANAFDPL
jgi:uncharacterized protein